MKSEVVDGIGIFQCENAQDFMDTLRLSNTYWIDDHEKKSQTHKTANGTEFE